MNAAMMVNTNNSARRPGAGTDSGNGRLLPGLFEMLLI
jgi:hypothetical protein